MIVHNHFREISYVRARWTLDFSDYYLQDFIGIHTRLTIKGLKFV